ncbi:MAG: YbaB/EbfC family nucleoid-associated protein [Nocardioides sp.]|uniref:YbaB/EbfC family nucleoid-associated protein n=1 Tax=Nocardioides sp. TaxID=35761 RepID=UPI003EFD2847
MSQNPFDALSGGGFDMNALLEQAQQMQQQIADAQAGLANSTVTGSVAGGAVTVDVNGLGELTGVTLSEGAVESTSAEDLADLGDLIVAAYRDARAKADAAASEAMGPLAGGAGLDSFPGLG